MKVSDFNYKLLDELIAKHPPKVRGASNLLVLNRKTSQIQDRKYADIVDFLNAGDVLVLNDTKVMRSRIKTKKASGVRREIVVLERHRTDDDWHHHKVMYRGKIKTGEELFLEGHKLVVDEVLGDGLAIISSELDLIELTNKYGAPPLPPYMHRDATLLDIERYQTVFARDIGSAAAPTASLNMTNEILDKLRKKGVRVCYLTLHVGLGTFMPIRTDEVEQHHMHAEYFEIPPETVAKIHDAKKNGRRVVALGTTVARTLEYAFPKNLTSGEADIFIYPGYDFECIDALITNFHAPKSTVLMLTAAFAGWENLKTAYEHAKAENYKFLSYGDSMLIK